MIDGGRVRIWSNRRAPLNTLETPVITLSGGKDGPQRIAQRIEGNNIRGRESGHGRKYEEGKEGNGYW
jgi:hypothetical protein